MALGTISSVAVLTPEAKVPQVRHVMSRNPRSMCSECGWGNTIWSPFFCVVCGVCESCARKQPRCAENEKSGFQSIELRRSR